MNTSYLETYNILWTFIPLFFHSSHTHIHISFLLITAEVIFLKFIIEQVILIIQILHSIWIAYRIKWKKKLFHCLQDLHSMLLLYHLSLIKNEHTHTHISSCLWLIFSFFEYVCIRVSSHLKAFDLMFSLLGPSCPGIFKRHVLILHMSSTISPQKIILVHTICCLYHLNHSVCSIFSYLQALIISYITFGLVYVSITYLLLLENRSHKNRYFIFLILMLQFLKS